MTKHFQSEQHPDTDHISAFVDHALPAHEREEMLAHLAGCADCRETVALSLPTIESVPAAVKKTKSWLWDFRLLLPAGAAALAIVLLYVHHAMNTQREGVRRAPEIALEQPAAPAKDQKSSPSGVGGGAGSTTFAGRVLEAPRGTPPSRAAVAPKEQSTAAGNGLAVGDERRVDALRLPDGAMPISTVTRGRQVLAIDDRNELFLSKDGGKTWESVQVPWKGRAVKAELASYPIPAASGWVRTGANSGVQNEKSNTSDAVKFRAQKSLREELKGSYKAPVNGNSDAPSAAPVPTLTAPPPASPSALQGTLSGLITDRSGAIIAGASVALTNPANHESWKALTGADGRYHIDALAPGTYQLEAQARGFNTTKLSAIQIDNSSSNTTNVVLGVGAVTQTVTVQVGAPEIEPALPELGRNAISLKQKSASTNGLVRPTPVFEVTTDSGDHWISPDGVNWQRR